MCRHTHTTHTRFLISVKLVLLLVLSLLSTFPPFIRKQTQSSFSKLSLVLLCSFLASFAQVVAIERAVFRGETRRRKIEFRGILEIARKEFEKERKVERVLRRSRRGKKKEGKSEEFDRSTLNRRAPFPLGHPRGTDVSAFAAETHRYAHTHSQHIHTHSPARS